MGRARSRAPSLDAFVENLPGNVYRRVRRLDGSYYFEYLSRGLFRQFDIDNERLLAQDPIRFDWIHPDDRARFVSDLEISAATLGLLDHRVRVVGADGRVHWARGIARPSRRADGSVVWDGIVIDVTREVEAEAALRVAKGEADRAHATTARIITDVCERLGKPVREMSELLMTAKRGGCGKDVLYILETLQVKVSAALGELASQADPSASNGKPSAHLRALTSRQKEVLDFIAAGLSNKMIAQRLKITPGTVKLHVAAILRAAGVRSRRDLRR